MSFVKNWHYRDLFLERIYQLSSEQKLDVAIDSICCHMQELLRNKNYNEADRILNMLDPQKVAPVLMIAFLLISRQNKDMLLNRGKFFEETRKLLIAHRNNISDLDGL